MLIEAPGSAKRMHFPKWVWITGAILLAAMLAGTVWLATNWPFTRAAVIAALQEASGRQVRIRTFSVSYFPPGCTAGDVHFLRHQHPEAPPIITIQKLAITGSFTGLFRSPKRLASVRVVGMHMIVPPKTGDSDTTSVFLNSGPGAKALAISRIVADGAVLEFLQQDRKEKPYVLKVDRLAITDVGAGTSMAYRAALTNTEPPGVIRAEGKFGPWNPADIGATPVSGNYTYDDIDLSVFAGVAGRGHARGQFSGPLSRIQTAGTVDVAGFRVDGSDHSAPLATTYQATVNGTNGDVLLNPATAQYRNSEFSVRGWIARREGTKGKSASFAVSVPKGRIDDLLYLLTKGRPGLSGAVTAHGTFLWPPGPEKFLQKIRMDLEFGISGSRFTSPVTQDSINRISESAGGEKKKQEDADPRVVLSQVRGNVRISGGVATITNGSFEAPGADAATHGTYDLLTHKVDLHGTLRTRGRLSDTTSGFKALLLKSVTPLFRKKDSVRLIPFQITGAYGNTSIAIDWKKDLLGSGK